MTTDTDARGRAPRLTLRLLMAMSGAVTAMLAGEVGEGDWPEDVTAEAMDEADRWISHQITLRTAPIHASKGSRA